MAHNSSLLLAPGSLKDRKKHTHHKQKTDNLTADMVILPSPLHSLLRCISPSSPTAQSNLWPPGKYFDIQVHRENQAKVASHQD